MPTPKTEVHYVTTIKVEKVVRFTADSQYKPNETTRTVTELAALSVKGNDLSELKSKITSHVSLVEDFDGEDPVRNGTR